MCECKCEHILSYNRQNWSHTTFKHTRFHTGANPSRNAVRWHDSLPNSRDTKQGAECGQQWCGDKSKPSVCFYVHNHGACCQSRDTQKEPTRKGTSQVCMALQAGEDSLNSQIFGPTVKALGSASESRVCSLRPNTQLRSF